VDEPSKLLPGRGFDFLEILSGCEQPAALVEAIKTVEQDISANEE
jgi:hypothetical protein